MFLIAHMPQISTLESEMAITLHFQLCSAGYTALQMKNSRRTTSAINPVTMENTDDLCAPTISYRLKSKSSHYASLSAMFSPLYSSTNKEQ